MRRAVIGLLVAPLLGFPLFTAALVTVDSLLGEGLFLHQATYEQRAIAEGLLADFVRALPTSYVAAALLVGLGTLVVRRRGLDALRPVLVGAGAALGLTLGSALAGSPLLPESLALALVGAVFGLVLSQPLEWLFTARAQRGA